MEKFTINQNKLFETFGGGEILYIATDTLNRIDFCDIDNDNYTLTDALVDAIDSQCIYNWTQWQIMMHYQSPQDANFQEAIEYFLEDLSLCIDSEQ